MQVYWLITTPAVVHHTGCRRAGCLHGRAHKQRQRPCQWHHCHTHFRCMIVLVILLTQIREPPADGMFVYGVYLWGCHFEKTTTLELFDSPPKSSLPSLLPVIHLSAHSLPLSTQTSDSKSPYLSYCPCFATRSCRDQPLFFLKITSNDTSTNKWAMRNLFCTLRPF